MQVITTIGARLGCGMPCGRSPSVEASLTAYIFPETGTVPGWYRSVRVLASWVARTQALGHTVRLMPPAYVKPYVKQLLLMPKQFARRSRG
jgi:hypothetical protein